MSSSYDSSSIESFNVKDKLKSAASTTGSALKSAASTTGSAIKKGGSAVVKGAKKVGGWFAGWIRWLWYGGIALLVLFILFQIWRFSSMFSS